MSLFDRALVSTMPFVPKPIVRTFSRRYVAGEKLPELIETLSELQSNGMSVTTSVLGEHVKNRDEAQGAVGDFVEVIEETARRGLDSNVSVKLTQIGLQIDRDFCEENLRKILDAARPHDDFVRIDMEDSSCTDDTLEIFRRVRRDYEKVGVVIQAYLRRSYQDVIQLSESAVNVRVCKGIYVEPREIAYKDPEIIRRNYMHLVTTLLSRGCYVGIATHDERLVWEGLRAVENLGVGQDRFEFQMLLGVDEQMRSILVKAGYRVRVYVPFGPKWYEYSMRRLKENPRIARYALQGIFGG